MEVVVKCGRHGDLDVSQCYSWGTGRKKYSCKECARLRSKAQTEGAAEHSYSSRKDWTGQSFNELTFVRKTDKRKNGKVLWELTCSCGNKIQKAAVFVVRGLTKCCGCKTGQRRAAAGAKSRKLDPRISSAKSIWLRVYSDGCDFETFLTLSQKSCTYCGCQPHRVYNKYDMDKRHPRREDADFIYNGLDRIDNSRDHSPDNVVPCCTTCNMMKASLSVADFLVHIRSVFRHNQPSA